MTALAFFSISAVAGIEQDLQKCATISDKLDRLICYDNRVKGLSPKISSPEASFGKSEVTVAPNDTQAPKQTVEEFGRIKPVGEQLERVEMTVEKVTKNPYGNITVTFTNGQVWKQTDTRRFKLKSNQKVFIKKGALGSFLMGTDGRNTTIRVKRIK